MTSAAHCSVRCGRHISLAMFGTILEDGMDSDRITGKAKETIGKVEAAAGDVMGDPETEARGNVRQAAGAAQDLYGQAKDTFGDSFSDLSDSTEKALHSLEREVKARPLIALLIAALIGYVLAQLTMR